MYNRVVWYIRENKYVFVVKFSITIAYKVTAGVNEGEVTSSHYTSK